MDDQIIDKLIREQMTPPDDLNDKILAKVYCRTHRAKFILFRKPLVFTAAAAIAIMLTVALLRMPSAQRPELHVARLTLPPLSSLETAEETTRQPAQSLTLAAEHNPSVPRASRPAAPQIIADSVRQVWVVPTDVKNPDRLLTALAESNQISCEHKDNSFHFDTTDRHAQAITDFLKDNNWQLLSPELPQPHEHQAAFFTGKPVHYMVTITQSDNQ